MIKNIGVFLGSFFIALGFSEGILRIYPTPYLYFHTRNIVQQTQSVPSQNSTIAYEPRPNLRTTFSNLEFKTKIDINSYGMRDQEYSVKPPEGIFRIIAVGDSFVFGWGVEAHETVTEILEKELLERTEVLNLGVSGYSTDQILERLKTLGLDFHPHLVLYFATGLPTLSSQDFIFRHGKMYFGGVEQFSWWEKIHFSLMRNVYSYVFFHQVSANLKNRLVHPKRIQQPPELDSESVLLLAPLRDMAKTHRFTPIVIYIPEKHDFLKGQARAKSEANLLESECIALEIPFLDLTPHLQARENTDPGVYFKIDDHWTRKGHRAAAEAIAHYLKNHSFLSQDS